MSTYDNNSLLSLISPNISKPNRITTSEKDKDGSPAYSVNYSKWAIGNANTLKLQEHINRININKKFYVNKQWIMPEDIDDFLKDESGLDNFRLHVTMNLIQQMGNMYKGTVSKMDFKGRVKSYSPNVKTRKDAKLEELLYIEDVARNNESLSAYLRNKYPIGKNEDETRQIFDNLYRDNMIEGMNDILKYCLQVNKFDKYKMEAAEDELCSGMFILEPYHSGGEWMFKRILPNHFFFDRSAIEYDLSDASYMGHWEKMMPTEIYERFPNMEQEDRKAIEEWVSNYSMQYNYNTTIGVDGRIPVFFVKWRDCFEDWYGYVINEFNESHLVRLNEIPEGGTKSLYTDKDLIPNKDLSPYQRKVLKIKSNDKKTNKVKIIVDYWRYSAFIPQVFTGISSSNNYGEGDICLEYGKLDYQEPDLYSPTNMKPPYKVNFYIYIDGEVISPVDIAINPQRMINRFLSVYENNVNRSGGSNMIYDKNSVEDEIDFLSRVKSGDPVGVNARGMPIQNITARYDNTISSGVQLLLQNAQIFKGILEDITGVNNAVKGQANSEQLVGVMQLQIQKGSLLQEPFYKCIENVFQDCYQNIVTAGKRFYLDNKERLVVAAGEYETKVLELTEDMRWEDCLCEVKRVSEPEKERESIDSKILGYMQVGLLNDIDVANLIGRADDDNVFVAVRERAKMKIETARIAQEQQQQQTQLLQQQEQKLIAGQQQQDQQNKKDTMIMDAKDKQHDIDKIITSGLVNRENVQQQQQVPQLNNIQK